MQCPKCQYTNVQLCSVAYDQGTVTATTTTKGQTNSQGTAGDQGHGIVRVQAQHSHHGEQTTVSRTAFAAQLAPPVNPIVLPLEVLGCLLVFLVAIIALNSIAPGLFRAVLGTPGWNGPGFQGLEHLTWAVIVASVVWAFFGFKKLPIHREKLIRWRKSWICGACGNQFVPESVG